MIWGMNTKDRLFDNLDTLSGRPNNNWETLRDVLTATENDMSDLVRAIEAPEPGEARFTSQRRLALHTLGNLRTAILATIQEMETVE